MIITSWSLCYGLIRVFIDEDKNQKKLWCPWHDCNIPNIKFIFKLIKAVKFKCLLIFIGTHIHFLIVDSPHSLKKKNWTHVTFLGHNHGSLRIFFQYSFYTESVFLRSHQQLFFRKFYWIHLYATWETLSRLPRTHVCTNDEQDSMVLLQRTRRL